MILFGDFKEAKAADIPLNAQWGKHVAELVATGNRPAIIGMRGWMTSHMVKFWIDFASTVFAQNAGELYIVGDEFHNFAPKGKIMDPDLGQAEREVLRVLYEAGGASLTKDEVARRTVSAKGTPYEVNGGGFGNALSRLRTYELISSRNEIAAAKEFFDA